jgi:hypothetical protein
VRVINNTSTGNRILRNSIFSNVSRGIDLVGGYEDAAGTTANDPGDADFDPNNLQNFPVLSGARTLSGETTIKGELSSTPEKNFIIRFFSNSPGGDEGKKFIGQKKVTTNVKGRAVFTFVPARKVGVGRAITAAATGPGGNTSEFSAPRTVAVA